MCRHTREPTVLFRVSCRPSHLNFDPFHQPCLLRWLTLYCRRLRLAWAGIGEDCRPRTTWRFSVSTITDGLARAGSRSSYLPLRWPDCTLSRLRAEEYDRPVTQLTATPEPSSRTIPTLDRTLVARLSLECVATPGSRRSCSG